MKAKQVEELFKLFPNNDLNKINIQKYLRLHLAFQKK